MPKKIYDVICECPVCCGNVLVTVLSCEGCGTEVRGRFRENEFARLGGDDLTLLRAFVTARGNLKEVEEALSISYPTVRGRLEKLAVKLGLKPGQKDDQTLREEIDEKRSEILARLEKGEIKLDEAEALLGDLNE